MMAATAPRRGRRPHQPRLPGLSDPIRTIAAVSNAVGDFFEAMTAQMVGGRRLAPGEQAHDNPDVQTPSGRFYESKGTGKSRWVCQAPQYERLVALGGWYALWDYRGPRHACTKFGVAERLQRYLAKNIRACYVMPARMMVDLIAETKHPTPVDSGNHWGVNYWVSTRAMRKVARREHRLQRRLLVAPRHRAGIRCRGQVVAPHKVYWIKYRADVDRVRHPTRRGWWATDEDRVLARLGLKDMQEHRLRVTLVPANPAHPQTRRGQKLRVIESRNPAWYSTLCHRRPMAPPRKHHSIRAYVLASLRHIIATGYIRPRAMDLEVLEILQEVEEFGP